MSINLLAAKFESPAVVRRKLQVACSTSTPSQGTITSTFQRFWETGTVEDKERSGRTSEITEEKIEEVSDVVENQPQSSVRTVATVCSVSPATAHRTMTQHLSLKTDKMHFVQELYEEDLQNRVEMYKTLIPMLEDAQMQGNFFFRTRQLFI